MKDSDATRVIQRVEEIASISMGLDVFPRRRWFDWPATSVDDIRKNLARPVSQGLQIGSWYIAFFCVLPCAAGWVFKSSWCQQPRLYAFQVYGGFWAAWATAATKITASATRSILQREILPYLSGSTADKIANALGNYDRARILRVSLAIGAVGATVGGMLMYQDLPKTTPKLEVAFWSWGWFLLFTTSASVVINGQFYSTFSRYFTNEAERLFGPDPSRSSLTLSLSTLGQTMLMFWFGVAFSIALIIPVAMIDWSPMLIAHWADLPAQIAHVFVFDQHLGPFVSGYLVTTAVFSIGLGTIVFLSHEAGIRRAVNSAINIALRPIEFTTAELLEHRVRLSATEGRRLGELSAQHAAIAGSRSYRSAIFTGISLVLPLILPVVTAIAGLFHR